jgi:hypothetical protein
LDISFVFFDCWQSEWKYSVLLGFWLLGFVG